MDTITTLFHVLVFPGVLFCSIIGFLMLVINARILSVFHGEAKLSVMKPITTFFKFTGKRNDGHIGIVKSAFILITMIGFLAVAAVFIIVPINGFTTEFNGYIDLVVIVYLAVIPVLAVIIGGMLSGISFCSISISREFFLMMGYGLPLALVFLSVGWRVGRLAGYGVIFSISSISNYQAANGPLVTQWSLIPAALALLMIIPYDLGTCAFCNEMNDQNYEDVSSVNKRIVINLYKFIGVSRVFFMVNLFIVLFVGNIITISITGSVLFDQIISIVLYALAAVFISTVFLLIKAAAAGIKAEWSIRIYWIYPTLLSIISLILVWMGM